MSDKIMISADCVCDLPEGLLNEYSIHTIPFYVSMNEVRFLDYEEVDFNSVYEYLETDKEKIFSSPPTVCDYRDFFRKLAGEENKQVIHICVSQKMSSAYKNALEAAKDMEHVHVVDSGLISYGIGLLALYAAKLARTDTTAEEILEKLWESQNKISCSFVLKTTQYIANNNRLNRMISNLLEIFRIKPILKVQYNKLKIDGICYGAGNAYASKYIGHVLKKRNIADDIVFVTAMSESDAFRELVYSEVTKKVQWKRSYMQDVSVTTLCNIGPGSVGVIFYTK